MTKIKGYQGGSIVSFVIVTVLAIGLLFGGAMLLRSRGDAARQASQSDIASGGASTGDSAKNGTGDKADDKKDQNKSSTGTGSTDSQKEGNQGSNGAGGVNELPSTGPAETIVTAIAIASLTYATARYFQSRRQFQPTSA